MIVDWERVRWRLFAPKSEKSHPHPHSPLPLISSRQTNQEQSKKEKERKKGFPMMMATGVRAVRAQMARSSAKARREGWRGAHALVARTSSRWNSRGRGGGGEGYGSFSTTMTGTMTRTMVGTPYRARAEERRLPWLCHAMRCGTGRNANRRELSTTTTISDATPLPDDDVIITPRCAERLAELTEQRGKKTRLRLAVEGGGCSGFSYVFELEEEEEPGE